MLCVPRQTVGPNWRGAAHTRVGQPYPAAGWLYAGAAYPSAGVHGQLTGVRSIGRCAAVRRWLGSLLCLVLRHSRWPAGRMRRRHHRHRNPPPWRHRRHAGNSSLSKRDLNGEHRVGIAQKPFQKRYLGLYIFCRLRPFASISLVRIGTSLVG